MGFDVAFFQLLFKMLSGQTGQISRVEYEPQKKHFKGLPVKQPFPRATPESQGISSSYIRSFLEELDAGEESNPHHVMILRHGKVITECSFAPYVNGMWHITHSLCKSFTGMAAGIAVGEGKLSLDEKLMDIFPDTIKMLNKINRKPVTIENLLNMTSEVEFSEAGSISGNDWTGGFMNAPCKCEPGSRFDYNSMNSFMISAVIQERYKMPMDEFLQEKLFDPLGIEEIFWERNPEGITKGGWGLFIRPEDAAKIAWMYMNHGAWNGTQIVPADWVKKSISRQSDNGKFGYGYQIWLEERAGSFAFNGLFGQNIICYPDLDMIILINAGNREMFADGELTNIQRKYWGLACHPEHDRLPEDKKAQKELADTIRRVESIPPLLKPAKPYEWGLQKVCTEPVTPDAVWRVMDGRGFQMEKKRIGIFPLICQAMHNNFTDGIEEVHFSEVDGTKFLIFKEGMQMHHVRIGFKKAEISEINLHGEPYYVGTVGKISSDEFGRIVLLAEIAFIEEACTRNIRIYFDGASIELRADETPGNDVIADALAYTGGQNSLEKIPIVKNIVTGGAMDIMETSVQAAVHGTDRGHLIV